MFNEFPPTGIKRVPSTSVHAEFLLIYFWKNLTQTEYQEHIKRNRDLESRSTPAARCNIYM